MHSVCGLGGVGGAREVGGGGGGEVKMLKDSLHPEQFCSPMTSFKNAKIGQNTEEMNFGGYTIILHPLG